MVLLCGCFTEGGVDSGSGPDDDDSGGSSASDDASAGSNSVSETTAGSQSGSASTTSPSTTDSSDETGPDDTGPIDTGPDDTSEPACGGLGESCCAAEICDAGACHQDRCVVFAGAYAEPMTCGGCTSDANGPDGIIPPSFIPYTGGCECAEAFAASNPLPTTSDYCPEDGLLHTPTGLRTCALADRPPGSDWSGVYVTSPSGACLTGQNGCVVENAITGACSCFDGDVEMIANTWGPCGGGADDQQIAIHVCIPTDVDPISFAGAYQTHWTNEGMTECPAPNPLTADCTCPAGFHGEGLRITSPVLDNGGEIFFCVP
jgi:hypothetical protein